MKDLCVDPDSGNDHYDCFGFTNHNDRCGSDSKNIDWQLLFQLVNSKGRRAFFVPLDQIQPQKDLCEDCCHLMFNNAHDIDRRGWYCWHEKWDNRGAAENPIPLWVGKGLHSRCQSFHAVEREGD